MDNQATLEPIQPKAPNPFGRKVKKFFNKLGSFFSKPSNVILVVFGIVLTVVVVYPMIKMLLGSLTIANSKQGKGVGEPWGIQLKKGDFTFLIWPYLLANPQQPDYSRTCFWIPLGQSALMSLIACAIAVIAGGTLAFLITRTNLPFKKFVSTVFIFPYIMPSWSIAMFWSNFFDNPAATGAKGLLYSLTGICTPAALVNGFWPSAIVLGIHYAPFAYILIGGILRNMDANLEEAATILKASRWKILWRITLPIVAPAMISTILLVFSSSISSYTVPYFLYADGKFKAISIVLRSLLSDPGTVGEGYVVATMLMIFSVLILTLNNWFTKSRRGFTTVSGKSGQISKINLGKVGKWIVCAIVCILVTFFAIVPLITFVLESVETNPGDITTIDWRFWFANEPVINDTFLMNRGFSMNGVFFNKTIWEAFGRSILLSAIVALCCGTFGMLIGYAVAKNRKNRFANYVSSIAFLPYLLPALSFATTFFAVIKTKAFGFLDVSTTLSEWSAIAICAIVGGVKFLPFASRSGTNAMLQLSGEIEEAAVITGCSWPKRMARIIFPIQKSSFISGYLLPFISCMREFTLFTLLTSSVTLATNVMDYYSRNGADQLANGINLLLVVAVIGTNLLVNGLTGASIDKGIGG